MSTTNQDQIVLIKDLGILRKVYVCICRLCRTKAKNPTYKIAGGVYLKNTNEMAWNKASYFLTNSLIDQKANCKTDLIFMLYLSTITYLGIKVDMTKITRFDEYIISYFANYAQKQFGSHVYLDRFAGLIVTQTGILDDQFDKDNIPIYSASKLAPISSVYPVLRNEWNKQCVQSLRLVMGLLFKYFVDQKLSENGTEFNEDYYHRSGGQRHYYREFRKERDSVRCGGVYELIENEFLDRIAKLTNEKKFAIYVCAGAKLVVTDQYIYDQCSTQKDLNHNRSLLQQGGVVVVERELKFYAMDYRKASTPLTLSEAVEKKVTSQDVSQYTNPVIFLGANESDHNSIAWELIINRIGHKKGMDTVLRIPEGGYIVAIEDWKEGIAEIYARHQYERLFESNITTQDTTYSSTKFTVPTNVDKILGMGVDRSRNCDISPLIQPYPADRLRNNANKPKEFNFDHIVSRVGQLGNTCRYPMPPMYPPIKVNDRLIYLPNRSVRLSRNCIIMTNKVEEFEKHYKQNSFGCIESRNLTIFIDDRKRKNKKHMYSFKLVDTEHEFDEYEWLYLTKPPTQSQIFRTGVDAHRYWKQTQIIGRYKTMYYELINSKVVDKNLIWTPTDPPMPQISDQSTEESYNDDQQYEDESTLEDQSQANDQHRQTPQSLSSSTAQSMPSVVSPQTGQMAAVPPFHSLPPSGRGRARGRGKGRARVDTQTKPFEQSMPSTSASQPDTGYEQTIEDQNESNVQPIPLSELSAQLNLNQTYNEPNSTLAPSVQSQQTSYMSGGQLQHENVSTGGQYQQYPPDDPGLDQQVYVPPEPVPIQLPTGSYYHENGLIYQPQLMYTPFGSYYTGMYVSFAPDQHSIYAVGSVQIYPRIQHIFGLYEVWANGIEQQYVNEQGYPYRVLHPFRPDVVYVNANGNPIPAPPPTAP